MTVPCGGKTIVRPAPSPRCRRRTAHCIDRRWRARQVLAKKPRCSHDLLRKHRGCGSRDPCLHGRSRSTGEARHQRMLRLAGPWGVRVVEGLQRNLALVGASCFVGIWGGPNRRPRGARPQPHHGRGRDRRARLRPHDGRGAARQDLRRVCQLMSEYDPPTRPSMPARRRPHPRR
jgi:hypothetical protein